MAYRFLLVLLLFLVGDVYFYQAVVTVFPSGLARQLYWAIDILVLASGMLMVFLGRTVPAFQRNLGVFMAVLLLLFVPRLLSSPILIAEDLLRIIRGFPERSLVVSEMTLIFSGLALLLVIFGLTRGRHFYQVRRETIFFPDLPEAFDGFTLTQLSDIHSGSFSDEKGVRKGIDLVNSQQSDVILFTGDLVNNQASEMERWIPAFSRLRAPMGKYSVLGNHDYGDYIRWESQEAKLANLRRLKQIHHETGFRLLLNESVTLEKDGSQITLVGVENWGKGGFHKYGDLKLATQGVPDQRFKILLSHDPSHWEAVVLHHPQPIQLTLSGHTHGMQFGIELFGFRWSPIQYMYPQWAGLYHRDNRYLYVNRGFGFLGLKGRIGIWPEITVITLRRAR